jgi:hypothetical protein
MGPMILIKAFALMMVTAEGIEVNAVAPWMDAPTIVHYQTSGHSTHARMQWRTESLNPSGVLPSVQVKGPL